ncbi:MAG TPA: tRNA (pseudouridine(54)-N(1))-methyltransferase TrmY [Thermoplasmata archaeon]|nr:tRNA (pseudouridine(54)-N(1))-methyltransferase TrmY [Thermoplasmata archaeon]
MQRLVLLVHRVPASGAFTLNDLAGGGGRMDEVARCVSTAFLASNALRRDLEMTLLFAPTPPVGARRIRVQGERLKFLHPDERSTAALLKNALVRAIPAEHDLEASPGILVGPVDPSAELARWASAPGAVWLTEAGAPAESAPLPEETVAILGDADDPTATERGILEAAGIPKYSLGPRPLRASQCVDVWLNRLDRRGPAPSG